MQASKVLCFTCRFADVRTVALYPDLESTKQQLILSLTSTAVTNHHTICHITMGYPTPNVVSFLKKVANITYLYLTLINDNIFSLTGDISAVDIGLVLE